LLEVMTQHLKLLVWLAGSLVLHTTARAALADSSAHPYQGIPARNVFGLKPPEVHLSNPPPPPLAKIIFAGMTTFPDRKCVLLKVRLPANSGAPVKEWSCILTEGERAGPIEVLRIDEKARSVTVRNSGTEMGLTFEKDGPVLRTTPLPPELPPTPVRLVAH
jgi:hypothetical protein